MLLKWCWLAKFEIIWDYLFIEIYGRYRVPMPVDVQYEVKLETRMWHNRISLKFFLILQDLRLSAMGLEHIDTGAFCNLHNISTLDLYSNKLTLAPELCVLKRSLVNLFLSDNKMSNFRRDFFEGYTKLKRIHLSNNKLINLPDLHWIQHSITHIKAAYNKNTHLICLRQIVCSKYYRAFTWQWIIFILSMLISCVACQNCASSY